LISCDVRVRVRVRVKRIGANVGSEEQEEEALMSTLRSCQVSRLYVRSVGGWDKVEERERERESVFWVRGAGQDASMADKCEGDM
jgi:hypothetical protein